MPLILHRVSVGGIYHMLWHVQATKSDFTFLCHYSRMCVMASQNTGDWAVCLTVCSGQHQITYHSSISLASLWGESTGVRFHCMTSSCHCRPILHHMGAWYSRTPQHIPSSRLPFYGITKYVTFPGLILGLCPTNGRRRYFVTASLIGWVQA